MATVLLAWEMGAGLGHFMNLRPLAQGLSQRGHRVIAVLRDLSSARRFFPDPKVSILQAPFMRPRPGGIEPICTFAEILHTCGFGDADELAALAGAWRNLYDQIKPDLIVFDHSPTALLAARGVPARRALLGAGFFSPPDVAPLPNLRTWVEPNWIQIRAHEARVLENINAVLGRWGEEPLERVAQLYRPVDEEFLLTFRELDCYPQRGEAQYWGMWTGGMGTPPQWPPGRGQRIFAYLKPFEALPELLKTLCSLPNPTLLFASGIDEQLRSRHRSSTLRYVDEPIEMNQAARECELAILNGTASVVAMLMAGKPSLIIPIFLEQAVIAFAAERLGAAICSAIEPNEINRGLHALLTTNQFSLAAQAFAARYADYNLDAQIERLVNRAEELTERLRT